MIANIKITNGNNLGSHVMKKVRKYCETKRLVIENISERLVKY